MRTLRRAREVFCASRQSHRACSRSRSRIAGVIGGLVRAIFGMARYQIVGMAGTSPDMTPNKWFNMTGTRSNSPSIPSIQEPSRDHLCLDLGRAFENRENARVAQYAGNLVFERKPVAAMDLDRVVGGGPGDPCGQKLRHPCLEVAAAALVLFP